ncbi:hypothetical protein Gorai_024618, partial [Gossypium raimondii]|nr:hypothetical protein [Gossypium raimondii]
SHKRGKGKSKRAIYIGVAFKNQDYELEISKQLSTYSTQLISKKTDGKQNNKSCSGIMVKDSNGQVLNFKICLNKHIPTIFATKALACAQATQFRMDLGIE